jgi:hypothetical protein
MEEVKKTTPVEGAEPTSAESAWGSVENKPPTKEQVDEMKRLQLI